MYTMHSPYTPMQRIERMKVSMINNARMSHLAGILMIGDLHITREYPMGVMCSLTLSLLTP